MPKQEKKPKKLKRSKIKYPALTPKYNSRVRQEYLDMDYLGDLNPEELAWMDKFMAEYNNASFNHDKTDIDQSAEGKKASYDRNNARNRDQYGLIKAKVANTKLLNYENVINMVEEELSKGLDPSRTEDAYIDYLDFKEVQGFIKEYELFMKNFNEETG